MDNRDMSDEQVAALLAGNAAGPPYNPKKEAATIARDIALYHEDRSAFEAGQTVRQRIGLCVQKREYANLAYGFVKYLEGDEAFTVKFPEYHALDCVLASTDVEGDAHFFLADSHRYEVYPQEDLDRLGAEAAKAVN